MSSIEKEQMFAVGPGWHQLALKPKSYIVMTLHRPANVDEESQLKAMLDEIIAHTQDLPLIFPVHPRTAKILERLNVAHPRLQKVAPLSYLEFNYLVQHAKAVITDSGGITEEASVMNIPCMTLRDNTERPETMELGTNELVGTDPKAIKPYLEKLFKDEWKTYKTIPLWDGKTAQRIVKTLIQINA